MYYQTKIINQSNTEPNQPEVFYKKKCSFFNFTKVTGKELHRHCFFLIKLKAGDCRLTTLLKKPRHWCFPVNCEFCTTPVNGHV